MKLMLLGYGRAGKGTFCKIANQFGLSSIASSRMACELFLFEKIKEQFGYKDIEECYNGRHSLRQLWYEEIKAFNTPDKTALGTEIFLRHPIYDGCRDKDEFNALKAAGAFDISIWIDAGDRIPPESIESMNITKDMADLIITNTDGKDGYLEKCKRIIEFIVCTQKMKRVA